MKLYIVRHGETEENKKWIIQGNWLWTLSELWFLQAEKLSERLKKYDLDLAFSSDLDRAKNTAKTILKKFKNVGLAIVDLLEERDYWKFVWMTHEERNNMYPGKSKEEIYAENPDVENLKNVYLRAKMFYEKYLKKYEYTEKNILVVWHKHIDAELYRYVEWRDYLDFVDDSYKNASLSIYEVWAWIVKCLLFNDAEHLKMI